MRLRTLALSAAVVVPATAYLTGGWAVVTVENPPERVVVGVPYTLEYSVRQHGIELMSGLTGRVEARGSGSTVAAEAKSAAAKGKYSASLTFPSAGSWTITVNSGFGPAKTTLLPVTVTAAGAAAAAMSDAERGQHLFVAKGCATCHVEMKVIPVDVRTNKYDEKFVKQLLADPKAMPKRYNAGVEMPNLGLKPAEIAALSAYLTGTNSAGTR